MPSLLFKYEASNPASHRRDLMLLVQVAGLLATAWLIWSISLLPRLNRESLADVITQTLAYTLLAFLASAVITFVGSRGRHLGWPVFLVIGILALYGAQA